jgi:hypothetical protein
MGLLLLRSAVTSGPSASASAGVDSATCSVNTTCSTSPDKDHIQAATAAANHWLSSTEGGGGEGSCGSGDMLTAVMTASDAVARACCMPAGENEGVEDGGGGAAGGEEA